MEAMSFAFESPVPFIVSWQYSCGCISSVLDDDKHFIELWHDMSILNNIPAVQFYADIFLL